MRYFVVNTESRKTIFGPHFTREDADRKHYDVCSNGILSPETGEVRRPRCAVVGEDAIIPNEHGNHFLHEEGTCVAC